MKFCFFIILIVISASCTKSNEKEIGAPDKVGPPGVVAEGGDISSGGGGILPNNPVSASYLFNIVVEAKRDLRAIIKAQHELFYGTSVQSTLRKKLFGGDKNLYDVLESTDIEILMDKPCYDKNGKEVDGSIYASVPNAICISPFLMAPKLIEERARVEVMALLVHELSHLLGTTEPEAIDLQKSVATQVKGIDEVATLYWVDDQAVRVSAVANYLRKAIKDFDQLSFDEMNDLIGKASAAESKIRYRHPEHFISLLDGKESDLKKIFVIGWFRLVSWYVTSQSNHHLKDSARKKYEETFSDKDEVSYKEFAHTHADFDLGNFYGEAILTRIQNSADLLEQVKRLYQYFDELSEHFYKIKSNQAMSTVRDPYFDIEKNPWSEFKGEYTVTNKKCVENGLQAISRETAFTVKNRDDGKMAFVSRTANSYSEMGVFNDAGDVWGGSTVKVSGDSSSVLRTAEFGTSWNKEWRIKSYHLERLTDSAYRLNKRTVIQNRRFDFGKEEHSMECIYDLSHNSL